MIIKNNELNSFRADHEDQTIALRLGCYDVLHHGHQEGIDFAASQADMLVIGVMPDDYIVQRKRRLSINSIEERVAAIDVAEGVDISFAMKSVGTLAILCTLLKLQPDVYVEGKEHGEKLSTSMLLGALGVRYAIDRERKVASSSEIISRFGSAEAARLSDLKFQPEPYV